MAWTITGTLDEASYFDDHIRLILTSDSGPLPAAEQSMEDVVVRWDDVGNRRAYIQAMGGTVDDRLLAIYLVDRQLRPHGYKQAAWEWNAEPFRRTADWNDIMNNAKILIQSGGVQILRNGPENIVAKVQSQSNPGTTHDVEIFRQDPNSQSMTGSDCDCGWGEFQNQPRTRQWKKFQDRPCWLRGSMVHMADGSRMPIEDIQPGMRVLSAHGPQVVSHVWENEYQGEMKTIKWMGNPFGTTITADHKMITHPSAAHVWRNTDDTGSRSKYTARALQYPDGWKETLAKDVREDDWVKLAYPTEVNEFKIRPGDFAKVLRGSVDRVGERNHMNTTPFILSATDGFLTIVGYYLAEGSIENGEKTISWTFADHEVSYVDALEKALQELDAGDLKRYPQTGRITVKVSNVLLARVLKYLCGDGAKQKFLAPELMTMDPEKQRFLLERYAEGDGTGSDFTSTYFVSTASKMLAHQLVAVGARVYPYIPAVAWSKNSGGPTNRDASDLWLAKIRLNQKYNCGAIRLIPGYYAARVLGVVTSDHEGVVYNLTVPPFHTVCVDGVCSYQCKHILAAWWQAQSTPTDEDAHPAQQSAPSGFTQQPEGFGAPQGAPGAPVRPTFDPSGAMGQSAGPGPPPPSGGPAGGAMPGAQGSPADVLPQFPMANQPQVNPVSVPGLRGPTPTDPIQYPAGPGSTFSSWNFPWHLSADDDTVQPMQQTPDLGTDFAWKNPNLVQLRYPDTGTLVGRSEDHGAGGQTSLPAGSVGEIRGTDPATGMINVLWMGKQFDENGRMEPFGASGWHFRHYLVPRPDLKQPGPAIRRRR